MFEFGSWKDATSRAGKTLTTTKWIDRGEEGRQWGKHSSDAGLQHATMNRSTQRRLVRGQRGRVGCAAGRVREIREGRQVEEVAVWNEEGGVRMGGRLRAKTGGGWVSTRQSGFDDILPPRDAGACRSAR